jgi:hypothetical protein
MALEWSEIRCLENSIKDFLDDKISANLITDLAGDAIPVYIKNQTIEAWSLPCITLGVESVTSQRFYIGSNKRDDKYLIIFDIFAQDEGQRIDLACWLKDIINDGLRYREYRPNSSTPTEPTYEEQGWIGVDFINNSRINLGQDASEIDAHRHRITVSVWISGT